MKKTKYYIKNISLVIAVFALAFYGKTKLKSSPYRDKDTYGVVYDISKGNSNSDAYLKLDNNDTLVLHSELPRKVVGCYYEYGYIYAPKEYDAEIQNYKVGDTVWFRYDKHAEAFGELFPDNVIKNPGKEQKDFIRQQQDMFCVQKTR